MIDRIQVANTQLYSNLAMSLGEMAKKIADNIKHSAVPESRVYTNQPQKTSKIVIIAVVVIALACIVNTAHNLWPYFVEPENALEQPVNDNSEYLMNTDTTSVDSTTIHPQRIKEEQNDQGLRLNE